MGWVAEGGKVRSGEDKVLSVLSELGVTAAPGYKIVRESEHHWQFYCRYGEVPVDCCVYTGDDTALMTGIIKAVLYIAVGDDAGTWVGDIDWKAGVWAVGETHIDRLLFGWAG